MKRLIRKLISYGVVENLRKYLAVRLWKIDIFSNNRSENSKRYLIATNIGGNLNTLSLDVVIAKALESRGHRVDFTICGGNFDGCMYMEINKFNSIDDFINRNEKLCKSCNSFGLSTLRKYGYNPIILNADSELDVEFNNSESSISGVKRFLAVSNLNNDYRTQELLKKFGRSSANYTSQFEEIFKFNKYDAVIAHHGIYVPQGDVVASAKKFGVTVFTWVQGYRKSSYIFAKNDTYHKTLMFDDGWDRALSGPERAEISDYLSSRDSGENDWIRFGLTTRKVRLEEFFGEINDRRIFLLLTNVSWDAQLHYDSNAFSNMFDWLRTTIEFFQDYPQNLLIIRIHPAEVTGKIKSREPVSDWIKINFSSLPPNILVVEPTDDVSTYSLMKISDFGLIYASKSGLEMLAQGKKVIVSGEAWIKNKGLCLEPKNKSDYLEFLKIVAEDTESSPVDIEKVLRYAHYFFFRRTISISSIKAINHYPYALPKLSREWVKKDPNLLQIIQSIESDQTPQLN
jgi:hypothetical protein